MGSKRMTCKEWYDGTSTGQGTMTADLNEASNHYVYKGPTVDSKLCKGKKCTVAADASTCLSGTCAQLTASACQVSVTPSVTPPASVTGVGKLGTGTDKTKCKADGSTFCNPSDTA